MDDCLLKDMEDMMDFDFGGKCRGCFFMPYGLDMELSSFIFCIAGISGFLPLCIMF